MTLYLKYRPKNLDELDLNEVRESLKKIVSSGNIPHAFLFAGPKGTGKTSAARILAKIANCEKLGKDGTPCDKCEQCMSIAKGNNLDVIEMDAASHRGIDDVRTLKDAINLAPTKAKKKIYIIDEAHMLTTEASNALLKTLEEPPAHVVFILATTNPEKLIDTIRSRTTFIPFRKASAEEVGHSLERVIKGEKIKVDTETLASISKSANGSFRDAVKILEQFSLEGSEFLDKENINDFDSFIDILYKKDLEKSLKSIEKYVESGVSIENFIKEILVKVQKDIIANPKESGDLIYLAELLIEANRSIPDSPIEEVPLEIAVVKWCGRNANNESGIMNQEGDEKSEPAKPEAATETHDSRFEIQDSSDGVREQAASALMSEVNEEVWKNILSLIKPINASIEALLRAARPVNYDGKILTLGVYYRFHKERLEDNQHRRVLEDIVAQVLKSPTRVICTLVEPPVKKVVEEAQKEPVLTEGQDQDIIKVAEEIFGN